MFHGEMMLEVERRLQQACDDRARAGLPPPVSVDALRAMVRSDLLAEIEAKRTTQKAIATKPVPAKPLPASAKPRPTPVTPPLSGMDRLIEAAETMNFRDPVLPTLRNPLTSPTKPAVDPHEAAAQMILAAGRAARG